MATEQKLSGSLIPAILSVLALIGFSFGAYFTIMNQTSEAIKDLEKRLEAKMYENKELKQQEFAHLEKIHTDLAFVKNQLTELTYQNRDRWTMTMQRDWVDDLKSSNPTMLIPNPKEYNTSLKGKP